MAMNQGPWEVTYWLDNYPNGIRQRLIFRNVNKDKLNADLTKAMNKRKITKCREHSIPAGMVHFRVVKAK